MFRVLILIVALALAGCSLTPEHKKWAGFVAGAVIVGMIAAHDDSDGEALGGAKDKRPIVPCTGDPAFCK